MSGFPPLTRSVWLALLLVLPAARAQQAPASPQSVADLEKRVRELEEIVRRLQAERAPSRPAEVLPAPAAGAVLPGVQAADGANTDDAAPSSPPVSPSPGGASSGSSDSSGSKS